MRPLRLLSAVFFAALGVLIVWLGLTGHVFFDRRGALPILGFAVLLRGGLALYKHRQDWTRWASLLGLGAVMLAMSRVPFGWVPLLMAVCGGLLFLRALGTVFAYAPRTPSRQGATRASC
jgi:hypothetical protein